MEDKDLEATIFITKPANGEEVKFDVATPYSKKKQVLAAFCATLGCLLNGLVIGYTGPALPGMMNKTESGGSTVWGTGIALEAQEASWITGLLSIGSLVGCLVAAPVMERFGRRITLLVFTSSLYLCGFCLILTAPNGIMILIGRFLNGMGLGFVLAVTSVYIVEIATTDMRGFLGCFVQFLGSIGVLLIFSAGCFLNWYSLAGLMIVMVVPFVVGMYFCPESPRWLYSKGREDEGMVALEWLRGNDSRAALEAEVQAIKLEQSKKKTSTISVKSLGEKSILKPFLISIFMMLFLNISGMNVMIFYCNSIFFYSNAGIPSDVASVIVGIVLLVSCFVAIFCITRLGRRVILITSMLGMSVCYFILGGCFYVIESAAASKDTVEATGAGVIMNMTTFAANTTGDMKSSGVEDPLASFPGWVPVLSILLLLFLGNGGYGTLIWVVTAEMLPPNVRSVANSVIICFSFIMGFIVSKTFVDLIIAIGASGTFWLYATNCLVGTVFTIFLVPETKGKTVQEIADLFK